jgi:hypothetical protein
MADVFDDLAVEKRELAPMMKMLKRLQKKTISSRPMSVALSLLHKALDSRKFYQGRYGR